MIQCCQGSDRQEGEYRRRYQHVTEKITLEPKIGLRYESFKNQKNIIINNQNYIQCLSDIKLKLLGCNLNDIDRSNDDVFYEEKRNNGQLIIPRYSNIFESAPTLCNYIKTENIGKYR